MRFRFLPLLLFLFVDCKQQAIVEPKMIWRSAPFGRAQIETIYPVFYKDKIIVSQNVEGGSFILCALNRKDGSVAWQYQDTSSSGKHLYYNSKPHLYGEIFVIPSGNRLIAFNLNNGKKIWDYILHDAAEEFLEGLDGDFFRTYYDLSEHRALLYSIRTETGESKLITTFEIPADYKVFYRTPVPVVIKNNDTVLVFSHIAQEIRGKKTYACLNWLNTRDKTRLIDTIYPVNTEGNGITKQPLLDRKSHLLYLVANDELVCCDVREKKQVWRKKMPRDMLTSAPRTDETKVYFPAEDGNLYALDKLNGNILWDASVSGTPGRLYDDGVHIHLVGGGDGTWHIINKINGQEVFSVRSPNAVNYPGIFFRRAFAVAPNMPEAVCTDGKDFFYYGF